MVLQKKEIHLEGHLGKEGIHRSTHIGGEKPSNILQRVVIQVHRKH